MLGALVACGGEGRGPIERGAPPPPSRADVAPPDAASVRIDAAIAPPEVASVEVDAAVDGGHAATTTPPAGLADVAVAIPDAVLDLRYATAANLTGAPLYPVARCWLRVEAVDRLAEAAAALRADGYRLVLWDCYRPASVQRLLWERVPDPRFVARPVFDDQGRPLSRLRPQPRRRGRCQPGRSRRSAGADADRPRRLLGRRQRCSGYGPGPRQPPRPAGGDARRRLPRDRQRVVALRGRRWHPAAASGRAAAMTSVGCGDGP
jgi:hypothetical protein